MAYHKLLHQEIMSDILEKDGWTCTPPKEIKKELWDTYSGFDKPLRVIVDLHHQMLISKKLLTLPPGRPEVLNNINESMVIVLKQMRNLAKYDELLEGYNDKLLCVDEKYREYISIINDYRFKRTALSRCEAENKSLKAQLLNILSFPFDDLPTEKAL